MTRWSLLTIVLASVTAPAFARPPLAQGLEPAAAAAAMTMPPGFEVKLLAAEPDVRQPIAMAFDDRGRLWVAEAYSYPARLPDDQARDRILIFEDTDGDDTLDRRTVFLDRLNLVSGLAVGFGGVWVGAAPHLLFIPDRDGDDVPDSEPEILLDGWGFEDTHETLNSFCWSPDGWLYGCHGVFTHSAVGPPGTPADGRVKLNGGVWRFHPIDRRFELFAEGTSNPWGVDFNAVGDAFATACVIPHLYHMFAGGRYQRQAGQHFNPWTFDDIKTIARHRHWVGSQWHQPDRDASDAAGGGHAHAGALVYLGDTWPEEYRGRLFMNNIHGARINQDRLIPSGSGYEGDFAPDFLFANDAWSQFISLAAGPDGQVVVIDWYDRNQCHHGDVAGHDRGNGRIFKISFAAAETARPAPVDLAGLTDAALINLLACPNEWQARHARRLLQERAAVGRLAAEAAADIAARFTDASATPLRLRYLWALHAIDSLDAARLEALCQDADPEVRKWAVRLGADRPLPPSSWPHTLAELARGDGSPVVRLAVASAAGRLPPEDRWEIVAALAARAGDATDHNLPLMIWYAAEPLVPLDPPRAITLATAARIPLVARFIARRAAFDDAGLESLVVRLCDADDATRRWMLEELLVALAARGPTAMPAAWQSGFTELDRGSDPAVRRLVRLVGVRFGDTRVLPELRRILADPAAAPAERIEARDALVAVKDAHTPAILRKLLADPALQTAAVESLAGFADEATPAAVLAAYAALEPAARPTAIATLVSRPAWALQLVEAVAAGHVPRGDLSAFTLQRLAESTDEHLLARLAEVWGSVRPTPAEKQAAFDRWRGLLSADALAAADLPHGRVVYAKTCGSCHELHGDGGRIGPGLTGSNRGDLEYLLANLLDPSGIVGRDYQATTVITTDGRSVVGIVAEETPAGLTLQTPTERITIPMTEIDTRVLSPLSLMPENQLDTLSETEARDLIAYLRHPEQVPLPESVQ
jgi:putative membrane-bound dehydrogenase-like protein